MTTAPLLDGLLFGLLVNYIENSVAASWRRLADLRECRAIEQATYDAEFWRIAGAL